MQSVRFLHTADWQLGMTRHFLDSDAQPRYTAARIDAIRALGRVAVSAGCEFVLVCGDVFESNLVGPRVVSRSLEAMGDIGLPVYLLPGNHDPLDAASVYTSAAFTSSAPAGVHVLSRPGRQRVRAGVEIVAAPWFSKRPLADLVGEALDGVPADGVLRVVAGHGAVDVLSADPTDPARIAMADLEAALARGAVHYAALGDRHSTTRVGESGRVWYSGTPEVTDDDETDPGNVLVVELASGRAPAVRAHRVGRWDFRRLDVDLTCVQDVDALDARLAALVDRDRCVVRLRLVGSLSLADKARLDAVLEGHARVLASVTVWEKLSDLAVYVDEESLAGLGVSGFAADAVAELALIASSGSGSPDDAQQARVARDALSLAYRLSGGGR